MTTEINLYIPTLKVVACTEYSIILEDIERSGYRLGTVADINDPQIAGKIAAWYNVLHQNGREYANTHPLYDECDSLTLTGINEIKEKTGTGGLHVWKIIEGNFDTIQLAARHLPRTLTYNDFHYTNLVVARDGSCALMFDYNMLGKGYVCSDIRNIYGHLGNEEARTAFLSAYGCYNKDEMIVDDVVNILKGLHTACGRRNFPDWGNNLLAMVKDGRLQLAVEKLLESIGVGSALLSYLIERSMQ